MPSRYVVTETIFSMLVQNFISVILMPKKHRHQRHCPRMPLHLTATRLRDFFFLANCFPARFSPDYPDLSISMTDEKYSSYYYLRYHNITHITSHLTTAAMPKEDFYLSPYQRLMKRISPTSAPEKLAEKAGKEQIQQPRRVSTISRLLKISGRWTIISCQKMPYFCWSLLQKET